MSIKLNVLRIFLKISRRTYRIFNITQKQIYLDDRIQQYENIWQSISTLIGATMKKLDRDFWEITLRETHLRVRLHEFPIDNNIVLTLCGRKPLVNKLLSEQDIPVPRHTMFPIAQIRIAQDFLNNLNKYCVVKPSDGYSGLGVTTHITKVSQLDMASVTASLYADELMIEEQIVGENYRILVYDGKVLHAVRRSGQHITGDGESSISQLLNRTKSNQLDKDLSFTLSAQNIKLDHIVDKGRKILVRSVGKDFNGGAELRTIYDTEVTELLHESIIQDAIQSAEIVGARFAGIDIITTDITRNLRETGGIVNEVNTTPALHHHYDSTVVDFPAPALYVVKDLFTKSSDRKPPE